MPLNINEFKARFLDSLPSSFYEMNISPPGGGGASELLKFRTENITLPGIQFFSIDNYSAYGNGLNYNIPYRYAPTEISVVHTVDQRAGVLEIFREWGNKIVDLDGDKKFGAYYFKDYVVDADIVVYNRKQKKAATIKLYEVYPISVDPVNLSWGENDNITKLSVSYRFTRYKVEK